MTNGVSSFSLYPVHCSLPTGLRPLIDPVVDGFVPELRVLRLEHPVAFVGEVKTLAGDVEKLRRVEELEAFAHIEAVVELAVNDERGRFEVLRREHGRPFPEWILRVRLAVVVPRMALELPDVEPVLFGGAEGGLGVEHAV